MVEKKTTLSRGTKSQTNPHETFLLAARDDLTISRAPPDTIAASLAS